MRGEPLDLLELDHVGGLVQGDPPQEELALGAELVADAVHVLADEQQPRRPRRADQGDVVLAEDPPRRVADRDPDLGSERRADGAAGDRAERAGQAEVAGDAALERRGGLGRVASAFAAQPRRSTSSATGGEPTSPRRA